MWQSYGRRPYLLAKDCSVSRWHAHLGSHPKSPHMNNFPWTILRQILPIFHCGQPQNFQQSKIRKVAKKISNPFTIQSDATKGYKYQFTKKRFAYPKRRRYMLSRRDEFFECIGNWLTRLSTGKTRILRHSWLACSVIPARAWKWKALLTKRRDPALVKYRLSFQSCNVSHMWNTRWECLHRLTEGRQQENQRVLLRKRERQACINRFTADCLIAGLYRIPEIELHLRFYNGTHCHANGKFFQRTQD